MKKLTLAIGIIICALCFTGNQAHAQIVDGAFQRVDISKKKPMAFPYVREADVMWSKKDLANYRFAREDEPSAILPHC